jgi:hypothetical protein
VLSSGRVDFVIVGGVAATIHGSARLTTDLDIVYERTTDNVKRLVAALRPLNPYLRGAPPDLPFRFDEQTIRAGRPKDLEVVAELETIRDELK